MRASKTVFSCLLLIPAVALGQSNNLDLLSFTLPGAKVIAGAHVDAAINSALGQFLVQQIQSSHPALQKFIADTGVDPRSDITEVVASSDSTPGPSTHALVAAHGIFANAITILEGAAGPGAVTHLTGVDLIHITQMSPAGQTACIGFYTDGATALAGDCDSVQAAIQAASSTAPTGSPLLTKAATLRSQQDLWFTSVLPVGQFTAAIPSQFAPIASNPLFKAIQQTSGGVKFVASGGTQGPVVKVTGETLMDSAKDATSILNVAKFIVSMVEMKGGSIPAAAPFVALLSDVQFSVSGNALDVNMTIPVSTLEQLFQHADQAAKTAVVL